MPVPVVGLRSLSLQNSWPFPRFEGAPLTQGSLSLITHRHTNIGIIEACDSDSLAGAGQRSMPADQLVSEIGQAGTSWTVAFPVAPMQEAQPTPTTSTRAAQTGTTGAH
jgi:hypothetical protein